MAPSTSALSPGPQIRPSLPQTLAYLLAEEVGFGLLAINSFRLNPQVLHIGHDGGENGRAEGAEQKVRPRQHRNTGQKVAAKPVYFQSECYPAKAVLSSVKY